MRLSLTRGDPNLTLTSLLALIALILIPFPASGAIVPSSDTLVPYFEVAVGGDGLTTLFAVGNSSPRPVDIEVTVYTNWGIPVITTPLRLNARAVQSVDLARWIVEGRLPAATLSADEIAHVQAALTGQRSPRDQMFYGSATEAGIASGYVTLRTSGTEHAPVLWGDFYRIDFGRDQFQAETLVDISGSPAQAGCSSHGLRFVNGSPLSSAASSASRFATEIVIWTGKPFSPSPTSEPAGTRSRARLTVFSEEGEVLSTSSHDVISVQTVKIDDLTPVGTYGWIHVETDMPVHIGEHVHSSAAPAAELHAYCVPVQPTETCTGEPRATLEFSINGDPADHAPGLLVDRGSTLAFTFDVANTGTTTLTDIAVTHDWGVATCPKTKLEPGESMTCVASGPAVGDRHENVGILKAQSPCGPLEVRDSAHYNTPPRSVPEIDVIKLINGSFSPVPPGLYIAQESEIQWTFVVKNTGDAALSGITLEDVSASPSVAIACPSSVLGPGESMTCGPVTTVALACAQSNTARVRASTGGTDPVEVADQDSTYYFGQIQPSISLDKKTNGEDSASVDPGAPITWTYLVTNTGDVALSNVSVTDNPPAAIACPSTTLAPGSSMTCTAAGTATGAAFQNTATARGEPPCGDAVTATDTSAYTVRTILPPSIRIVKLLNGQPAGTSPGPTLAVGSSITWTFDVTNTGGVALSGITVMDMGESTPATVACPKTALAPGESMVCGPVTGLALICAHANTAMVSAEAAGGGMVFDQDSAFYTGQSHPAIALDKRTNGADDATVPAGAPILWTYSVTNTGDVRLFNVSVTDDPPQTIACPKTALEPGESMTCSASGTALSTSVFRNTATARGVPVCGDVVTASDSSSYTPITYSVAIRKSVFNYDANTADGAPMYEVGTFVYFYYEVTNPNAEQLTNVAVSDDRGVTVTCPKTLLAPAESMVCVGSTVATLGPYMNIGTVTATSPGGTVTASDPAHFTGYVSETPAVLLQKLVNGDDANAAPGPTIIVGSTVQFTYVVTNIGNVKLTSIAVSDNRGVVVTCPKTALEVGEAMTCTGTAIATLGQYVNTGEVIAWGPTIGVSSSDNAYYYGVDRE